MSRRARVPRVKWVYVANDRLHRKLKMNVFKIGSSQDVAARTRNFGSCWPHGCQIRLALRCLDGLRAERQVHAELKKFNYYKGHGTEFFECDLAHIKAVVTRVVEEVNRELMPTLALEEGLDMSHFDDDDLNELLANPEYSQ